MKPFPDSIPPLDINSIPAGVTPIESEGDVNPIGVVRSKPFINFDRRNPDFEGAENYGDREDSRR